MKLCVGILCLFLGSLGAGEIQAAAERIDAAVDNDLTRRGMTMAAPCSDAVFLRRLWLDVLGRLPKPERTRTFLADTASDKRGQAIEEALAHPAFADFWSMRWGEVLRIKAEHPINLWPAAVQAYHRWLHQALASNRPYDAMVRDLLTASGSCFRVPPVNFYRAVQASTPERLAAMVAQVLLGRRWEHLAPEHQQGLIQIFSRLAFKSTGEWKEVIVLCDPAPAPAFTALMPDGRLLAVAADADPRLAFADWLLADNAPLFAEATANRLWSWLLGRGVFHPADDLRPDNQPVNPALLAVLADLLRDGGYDLRAFLRTILHSRTYQQSAVPAAGDPAAAAAVFACATVRPLEAEVLFDILNDLFSANPARQRYRQRFTSEIPEPFTFLPADQRAVAIADGSISSSLLDLFGRPSRDSGLADERDLRPTRSQRLHLLNATAVQKLIRTSPLLRQLGRKRRRAQEAVERIYLHILGRPPEAEAVNEIRSFAETAETLQEAALDLAWALVNSKEFLHRH